MHANPGPFKRCTRAFIQLMVNGFYHDQCVHLKYQAEHIDLPNAFTGTNYTLLLTTRQQDNMFINCGSLHTSWTAHQSSSGGAQHPGMESLFNISWRGCWVSILFLFHSHGSSFPSFSHFTAIASSFPSFSYFTAIDPNVDPWASFIGDPSWLWTSVAWKLLKGTENQSLYTPLITTIYFRAY